MTEEKEKSEFEETVLDHTTTDESGDVIDEKKLLRKLDWHLVPGLTLLLLLSFLDRGNGNPFSLSRSNLAHFSSVGNALIEGLAQDLHMSTFFPAAKLSKSLTTIRNKLEANSSPH